VRHPPRSRNKDSTDVRSGLWGFLSAWRILFDKFDVDRSGGISYSEFKEALVAFGYRLSPQFVQLLYRTYDRRGQNSMSFDLFVQACISLKRMTDVFKKYDEDRDGYITLSLCVSLSCVGAELIKAARSSLQVGCHCF
jgi:Ca2+-binding EF-hand superfamily protein